MHPTPPPRSDLLHSSYTPGSCATAFGRLIKSGRIEGFRRLDGIGPFAVALVEASHGGMVCKAHHASPCIRKYRRRENERSA